MMPRLVGSLTELGDFQFEPIKYEHSIEARIIVDDDDDGEFEGDKFTTVKFIRAVIPVKNGDRNNYIYIDKNGRITTYVIDLLFFLYRFSYCYF